MIYALQSFKNSSVLSKKNVTAPLEVCTGKNKISLYQLYGKLAPNCLLRVHFYAHCRRRNESLNKSKILSWFKPRSNTCYEKNCTVVGD